MSEEGKKGHSTGEWVREKTAEVLGADLRSLAAFRVALAVLVLADLFNRAQDLTAHYTDAGVMPRAALTLAPDPRLFEGARSTASSWAFSLNALSGGIALQAVLFLVAAVAAVALLVGYRTRVANIVVWVLVLSIQHRNPLVLASGDELLRLLLFWGMFLPLGAVWSVDRAVDREAGAPRWPTMRYASLATVALFLQIAFVYWFTALLKTGEEWRTDFTALYYALSLDQVVRPLGEVLLGFPALVTALTIGTILLEALGPFLLFSPFFTGPVRTLAVASFMGLHFGIVLTMDIGIFPFISILCMVCFLPAWFWDTALPKLRAALPKREALTGAARRLLGTALARVRARWAPLRARLAEGREPAGPGALRASFASDLLAVFFLVFVLFWNLTTVFPSVVMPIGSPPLGLALGLDQNWRMFAPRPTIDDGWYVIPGELRDGQQVDLMSVVREDFHPPEGVSWEKPENIAYVDNNEHWRKYLEASGLADHAHQRPFFADYLCNSWNARHEGPKRLRSLEIVYVRESTLPDYRPPEHERISLWQHSCLPGAPQS